MKPCGSRTARPLFLEEHLARLETSAREFRIAFPTEIPWQERLGRLVAANGLARGSAAVKILLTRGALPGLGLPEAPSPTLVIWARPYEPPPPAEYAAGWPVAVFPERRTTFLGRHKSLNYLFYLAARQYALDQGAREALILEADGLVSEGAATSLIIASTAVLYPGGGERPPRGNGGGPGPGPRAPGGKAEGGPRDAGPGAGGRRPVAGQLSHGHTAHSLTGGKAMPVMRETTAFLQECLVQEAKN